MIPSPRDTYAQAAESLTLQVLRAWALPDFVRALAERCVPLAAAYWEHLWGAEPSTAALVLRCARVLCEADRLRLIGGYLRGRPSGEADLVAHFLGAMRWESLPTTALEAAYHGDLAALEALLGLAWEASGG